MKTVFWLLVAVGVVYAFYAGAVAVWQYYEIKAIVEESVAERARMDRFERPGRVRDDILRRAPDTGVTLDARDVFVTQEDRTLRVLIRWSYPVIIYKGEALLAIPIAYDKSFTVSSGR
ncbi:MAG: hypothetical protein HYU25_00010 [Candidatus Rokubacteria bacterium]|nr:hypothetical protein [Candidatus Rokubacteria bacterium]